MTPEEITEMVDCCLEIAAGTDTTTNPKFVLKQAARMLRAQEAEITRLNDILNGIRKAMQRIDTELGIPEHLRRRIESKTATKPANPHGCGSLVYLVEDTGYAPGRVLAVIAEHGEACEFAAQLDHAKVEPRKLWRGQPTNRGYNE